MQSGNDEIVQAIFDKRGINFDCKGKGIFLWFILNTTPLHIACECNDETIIKLLTQHPNIDKNIKDVFFFWIF